MAPRAAIDKLPQDVRDALNQKLLASGFGDLVALSGWLAEQGYQISKSSVGEYSKGLKEKMEKSMNKARERMEIAKALRGATDDEKSALIEMTEMVAMDQLMDMYEAAFEMPVDQRMAALPKLIRASADLNRTAIGSARWKREFAAQVREDALRELNDALAGSQVDPRTQATIRAEILEKVLGTAAAAK